MKRNLIYDVSEIYRSQNKDGTYIFGFTVTYRNGRIRNITKKSEIMDEKIMQLMKSKKQKYELLKEIRP